MLTARGISQSSTFRDATYASRHQLSGCDHCRPFRPCSPLFPSSTADTTDSCPTIGRCATAVCNAVSGRDWRRADKPHYVGPREAGRWTPRDVGVSVPLVRLGITERLEDEDQSFLPTRPFFPAASSCRPGHLLSKISASLIFALLPDHSSIAILLSRKFCRFERRHFEVRRPWE